MGTGPNGPMTEAVRILSIDGGGIRGLLPARILQHIEEATGKPAKDLFHLIAGTSTGGIIGCGLLANKTARELGDMYARRGSEIFPYSILQKLRATLALFRFEISTGLDFKLPYTVNDSFDCATSDNIARLEKLASQLIESARERLEKVIKVLKGPKLMA